MPTTRRSAASAKARGATPKGQSTISFAHRVTKNVPKDTKKAIISPSVTKLEQVETPSPAKDEEVKEVEVEEAEPVKEKVEPIQLVVPEKSEAELRAEKITDAQIKKYWREIESQRIAPRVHQEDLDLNEKILRYFDVSSQYGPCIGITRLKRWQRAERLGLKPPVEVLAVVLKQESKGNTGSETAQMDHILNAAAAGA